MGHKAVETTLNINKAFSPETAKEHTVQWWLKKFCKGDKNLEDEECSGQPLEVSVQFSRSVASDSLRPHESQHARPPCPSPTPGVHSDSCPPSQ